MRIAVLLMNIVLIHTTGTVGDAEELVVAVNDEAVLKCTTNFQLEEWKHASVNSAYLTYVYTHISGLDKELEAGGRHNVLINVPEETYDLLITGVTVDDAGLYTCSSDNDEHQIELIVLVGRPRCGSIMSFEDVLVENDCGIEPDVIKLNCSVDYYGNHAPSILWSNSQYDGNFSSILMSPIKYTATSTVAVEANKRLSGTHIVCGVNSVLGSKMRDCLQPPNHFLYYYNNTNDSLIWCKANSSQTCRYRWIGRPMNSPRAQIGTEGQHISSSYQTTHHLLCIAVCRVRTYQCLSVASMNSSEDGIDTILMDKLHDGNTISKFGIAGIAIAVSLLLLAIICIIFRKKIRYRVLSKRKQKSSNETPKEVESTLLLSSRPSHLYPASALCDIIGEKEETLCEILDSENGLADHLLSDGVLNSEEYHQITKTMLSNHKQNRELLSVIKNSSMAQAELQEHVMKGLRDTGQEHIWKYMMMSPVSNSSDSSMDNDRILTVEELERWKRVRSELINLIDPNKDKFLERLFKEKCITERHKARIGKHSDKFEKNTELVDILKRRSYANLLSFKHVLRKTGQQKVLCFLDQETGDIARIHCQSNASNIDSIKKMEDNLSEDLNNPGSRNTRQAISDKFGPLASEGIHFVGASPTGSIILYFSCQTFQSLVSLHGKVKSGCLRTELEELFNRILSSSSVNLELTVSWDEHEYRESVQRARQTIHLETDRKSAQNQANKINSLDRLMLEEILSKIVMVNWVCQTRDNNSKNAIFRGYYIEYKHGIAQCTLQLASVSYVWLTVASQKYFQHSTWKRIFSNDVARHRHLWRERLDRHQELITQLYSAKVILERQKDAFLADLHAYLNADSSHRSADECRISRMKLNETIINFVLDKPARQIQKSMKMLKALEDTCQHHLFDIFTKNTDVQPVADNIRRRLVVHHTKLIELINPFIRCLVPYIIKDESTKDESQNCLTTSADNLMAYLRTSNCLSGNYEQFIKQLPDIKSRAHAIVHLLANGSKQTFLSAVEYFANTEQTEVVRLLLSIHKKEDVKQIHTITMEEMRNVRGIAALNNRIYVIFKPSNRIHVYRDETPFDRLDGEEINLTVTTQPYAMSASSRGDALFINNQSSRKFWRIKICNQNTNEIQVQNGTVWIISATPFKELLVLSRAEHGNYLEIYDTDHLRLLTYISLSTDIVDPVHAIKSSTGKLLISHRTYKNEILLLTVSEVSSEGSVVRSFNNVHQNFFWNIEADEDDNVFAADIFNDRVIALNMHQPKWEMLMDEKHFIRHPRRLCYSPEKDILLVGHNSKTGGAMVSIFKL